MSSGATRTTAPFGQIYVIYWLRRQAGRPASARQNDGFLMVDDPLTRRIVSCSVEFMTTTKTVRLTVAQALVTYLSRQYSVADGRRRRLIPATLGIFGHGNVAGLGQALDQLSDAMPFIQGRNEQALVHAATAFAKHSLRHATLAVTSSIGPGALNMVTGAALATVNRLPVLLLPGDTYATRHQGPVLQQLQHPQEADVTSNDAFRPVCRFFDRITRPEQLLTALPAAMRVLTDPADAGAVVISLPQDIQAHAYDWPARFFAERSWVIRRPPPEEHDVETVLTLLAAAERPLIIAGGGVIYSSATAELERLAGSAGIPVAETFAGKGAVQRQEWWQVGGIGLEGTPAANALAREADLVLTVGSRLTDFATASHSLFANPAVRFASVNVNPRDADRLGATGIIADARRALAALADGAARAGIRAPAAWRARAEQVNGEWAEVRGAALDPDRDFDPASSPDVVTTTGAVLTQGQVIGVLQEQVRAGDVVIAAAGGPPGDLLKVWDATAGRRCHLEFGFSCMGYEIPAALGVRLAEADPGARIVSFLGDGTFLLAPTELVTAAAEGLAVTLIVPDNHGYQVIHRLQMLRSGREFGNEFRYRTEPLHLAGAEVGKAPRLEGDYLSLDLVQVAAGLGARACRAATAAELRDALTDTRGHPGPVVIVVPVVPHADLPGAGVWWDVAPAEVSDLETTAGLRAEYEADLAGQRWFG
jgi:3D-(3,5/4)-trihydroxycyclohexane-1,2-dione acylhydrolase (decyclizing)